MSFQLGAPFVDLNYHDAGAPGHVLFPDSLFVAEADQTPIEMYLVSRYVLAAVSVAEAPASEPSLLGLAAYSDSYRPPTGSVKGRALRSTQPGIGFGEAGRAPEEHASVIRP